MTLPGHHAESSINQSSKPYHLVKLTPQMNGKIIPSQTYPVFGPCDCTGFCNWFFACEEIYRNEARKCEEMRNPADPYSPHHYMSCMADALINDERCRTEWRPECVGECFRTCDPFEPLR